MKILIVIGTLIFSTLTFARDLYPEEVVQLPSKAYQLTILKDIKMADARKTIFFFEGRIVQNMPKDYDLFYCELSNGRADELNIALEEGNVFRFSDDEGSFWDYYMSGRIWRKRFFVLDNDDVQYFSCNDTAAFMNDIPTAPLDYKKIKSAVGNYLKITIND